MTNKVIIYKENEHLPGPDPDPKIRKKVFDVLSNIPKSIAEIATEAGISEITARKHLEALKEYGVIEEVRTKRTLRLFTKAEE